MSFVEDLLNALGYQKPQKQQTEKPKAQAKPFYFTPNYSNSESASIDTKAMIESYRSWIYACVQKRAKAVSMIDLHLFKKKDNEEIEEIKRHEILDLLHKVNNYMTFQDLVMLYEIYKGLTGEAFWWIIRDKSGKPFEIYPYLRPDKMKVVPSETEFIGGYIYNHEGNDIPFEPNEIIYFKDPNPENPYRGLSPLKAAEIAYATDREAAKYNYNFFGNNARPFGIIEVPQDTIMSQDVFERLKEQWDTQHRGEGRSHKIAFLTDGMKYTASGESMKDMDFITQRKYSRDEILSIYGVPRLITEEVNRASAETSQYVFESETVMPLMRTFVNALNEFLLPLYGEEDLFFDFSNKPLIDRVSDMNVHAIEVQNGIASPNEIREEEGRDPYEGGNNIYVPFNLQPIGMTEKAKKFNKVRIPVRRTKKQIIKDEIKKEFSDKLRKLVVKEKPKKEIDKVMQFKWEKQIKNTDQDEKKLSVILTSEIQKQKVRVINSLTKKAYKVSFDPEEEANNFKKKVRPFTQNLVMKYGEIQASELDSEFIYNQDVIDWIDEFGLEYCESINETTAEKIKDLLEEAAREGLGQTETENLIMRYYGEYLTGVRLDTIVRTEISRGANWANYEAARQSGVVEEKEWFAALDERTCEICDGLDGTRIPLDEKFPLEDDFGDGESGNAHPNCRCVLKFIVEEKAYIDREIKRQTEKEVAKRAKDIESIRNKSKEEFENIKKAIDKK